MALETMNPALRQQVLEQLLAQAAAQGDRGDSTATIDRILGGVDIAGGDRVRSMFTGRNTAVAGAGQAMLGGVSDALAAQRAKALPGRGGSGGSGGPAATAYTSPSALDDWYNQIALTPPSAMPTYTPRVVTPTSHTGGTGAPAKLAPAPGAHDLLTRYAPTAPRAKPVKGR